MFLPIAPTPRISARSARTHDVDHETAPRARRAPDLDALPGDNPQQGHRDHGRTQTQERPARAERPRAARKDDRSEGGGEAPAAPPRRAGRARPRSQGRVHHGKVVPQRLPQRDAIRGRREVPHRSAALSLGDRGAAGKRCLDGGCHRRAVGRRSPISERRQIEIRNGYMRAFEAIEQASAARDVAHCAVFDRPPFALEKVQRGLDALAVHYGLRRG
jgi:hypothetical protein